MYICFDIVYWINKNEHLDYILLYLYARQVACVIPVSGS